MMGILMGGTGANTPRAMPSNGISTPRGMPSNSMSTPRAIQYLHMNNNNNISTPRGQNGQNDLFGEASHALVLCSNQEEAEPIHTHHMYKELMGDSDSAYGEILSMKIDAKKTEQGKQVAQQRELILNLKQVCVCMYVCMYVLTEGA